MAAKPTPKKVCPATVRKEHAELLNKISNTLADIKTDVAGLKIIAIKNGNEDGTPTMFNKDDFYQMIYNDMQRTPRELASLNNKIATVDAKVETHLTNSFKNNLGKLNWWLNALVPVALIILFIMYYAGVKDVEKIANEILKIKAGAK